MDTFVIYATFWLWVFQSFTPLNKYLYINLVKAKEGLAEFSIIFCVKMKVSPNSYLQWIVNTASVFMVTMEIDEHFPSCKSFLSFYWKEAVQLLLGLFLLIGTTDNLDTSSGEGSSGNAIGLSNPHWSQL